jgi:hypothetical protein
MKEELKNIKLALEKLDISPDRIKSIYLDWVYEDDAERAFPRVNIKLYKSKKKDNEGKRTI